MTAVIRDVDQLLTTTRAVRRRMDFDRPVERSVIEECVRLAQQAPMGSNLEDWRVVAVDDPALKAGIAELYQEVWVETVEGPLTRGEAATVARLSPTIRADDVAADRQQRILDGVKYLCDRLDRVPVLLIVCSKKAQPERPLGGTASGYYGSIFPFAWSIQLALRSRGLGSVMATAIAHKAFKVQQLLNLPDRWRPITMLPVGYTLGLDFRAATRAPVHEVLSWNEPTLADGDV
ncbi:MAG: nitroreductase family protein [Nocardioidaceae bacterium]